MNVFTQFADNISQGVNRTVGSVALSFMERDSQELDNTLNK